jgi:hypothetical protein
MIILAVKFLSIKKVVLIIEIYSKLYGSKKVTK